MASITRQDWVGLLAVWLGKYASPDAAKQLAKAIGYNDSPFFGAAKKRARLWSELVIVYVALAIYAINQRFECTDSKAIIDPFLAQANRSLFKLFESRDSGFKARYELRMTEYFNVLHTPKPALGLSFAFMRNCDLDPLKNPKSQVHLAAHFAGSLEGTLDAFDAVELDRSSPAMRKPHRGAASGCAFRSS